MLEVSSASHALNCILKLPRAKGGIAPVRLSKALSKRGERQWWSSSRKWVWPQLPVVRQANSPAQQNPQAACSLSQTYHLLSWSRQDAQLVKASCWRKPTAETKSFSTSLFFYLVHLFLQAFSHISCKYYSVISTSFNLNSRRSNRNRLAL